MAITAAQLFAIVSVKGAAGAVSALHGVSGAVNSTQSSLNRITTGSGQLALGLSRIAIAGGAAAVGGLAVAAKTSMDFADAFAGVRKTVDGSPAQLDGLYRSLEKLSTRVPVSFQDLAGIAQEAGALGVPTDKVDDFAEAVSRVTAATVGLDTGTASEAFGKLGTIFGLGGVDKGYERLGSVLIELGNTAASTEPDIIDIAQRFAAAGSQAHLSAAQVLGWSSAVGSLGQQPEAAGTALSRLFQITEQGAGTLNGHFKAMAKTAGTSAKAFRALVGKDAQSAIELYLTSLNKLPASEQAAALKAAGFGNVRTSQAILLLSSHMDLLHGSIDTANDSWQKNTALVDVSNKRFDTLKNKLIELKNRGFVALSDLGEGITPALGRLADRFGDFLDAHTGDFRRVGTEIGDAIDEIDWTKVESGAETVYGLLKDGLAVLRKIPPEIDLAVAGFLGLNKVSGGLLGAGVTSIAGGALGALTSGLTRGVASKVPGLGRLVATPVYIVGAAPGVLAGLAGGKGIVPVAAAGGASAIIPIGLMAIAAAGIAKEIADAVEFRQQTQNLQQTAGLTNAEAVAYGVYQRGGIEKLMGEARSGLVNSLLAQGTTYQKALDSALAKMDAKSFSALNAAGHAPVPGALGSQQYIDQALAAAKAQTDATKAGTDTLATKLDAVHRDLIDARADLSKATNPADILAAARRVVKDTQGAGGVLTTQHILTALQSAELNVKDPKQRAEMDRMIGVMSHRLAVREQMDQIISKDTQLLNQGNLSRSQRAGINADIRTLRAHGDTHAAGELVKLEQIRAKKLSATVNVSATSNLVVDGRRWAHEIIKWQGVPGHSVGLF